MIEIKQYKNAKIVNENGDIDCEIKHPVHGWIPFTVNLNDNGSDIDVKKLSDSINLNGDAQAYKAPTDDEINKQKAQQVRDARNYILTFEVDPIVSNPLRWADMTESKQDEWKKYRQDLLDITKQAKFPKVVTFPKKPE
tara:strand:+ start:6261 stop:6677 length:417 start_codon:yes stop_codon:yes gene_type:complete